MKIQVFTFTLHLLGSRLSDDMLMIWHAGSAIAMPCHYDVLHRAPNMFICANKPRKIVEHTNNAHRHRFSQARVILAIVQQRLLQTRGALMRQHKWRHILLVMVFIMHIILLLRTLYILLHIDSHNSTWFWPSCDNDCCGYEALAAATQAVAPFACHCDGFHYAYFACEDTAYFASHLPGWCAHTRCIFEYLPLFVAFHGRNCVVFVSKTRVLDTKTTSSCHHPASRGCQLGATR